MPKVLCPGAIGAPDTMPEGLIESPCCRDPVMMVHVYGGEPPAAVNGCEYFAFTNASDSFTFEIDNGCGRAMVRLNATDTVTPPLLTDTLIEYVFAV